MSPREELIAVLLHSREKIRSQLNKIDLNRRIYPLWTIREMLAHLSGWDETVIAFLKSLMVGELPATPANRGIDAYNVESLAAREGLDYDHIYSEFIGTRQVLLDLLEKVPEDKIDLETILPWGDPGTLVDIINIFGPHEEEHSEDIEKIIALANE